MVLSPTISPIYFPILRAKAGEIEAVARLSPTGRDLTRPMFDFPTQKMSDRLPLDEYLAEKIREIAKSWGTKDKFYLDFSRYEPDACLPDGRHVVDYVFDISRQRRLKAIPVVAPLSCVAQGRTTLKSWPASCNVMGVGQPFGSHMRTSPQGRDLNTSSRKPRASYPSSRRG